MTDRTDPPQHKPTPLPGLAALGCLVTGAGSLFLGLAAVLDKNDFIAAGLCLLASACAFGFLANALFRK